MFGKRAANKDHQRLVSHLTQIIIQSISVTSAAMKL
jgi:hypothetical protein